MTSLLDNLAALLLAGVVLLIMIATQTGASGLSIEETAMYGARQQAQTFASWLERDLTLVGQNLREGASRIEPPVQRADSSTALFAFSRDELRDDGAGGLDSVRVFTRYRLVNADSVAVGDSLVQVFGLARATQEQPVVGGSAAPTPGGWTEAGGSPSTLSYFRIELFGAGGRATTTPSAADFVRVRFSIVPPFANPSRQLRELHWGTTVGLRPF